MSDVTPGDARARVACVRDGLALAVTEYECRRIGPHALADSAREACFGMKLILEAWPEGDPTAGLYTAQGRILAELEAVRGRLTAQDDRITGIATDLQGLEIDVREGRRGDGAV